MEGRKLVVGDVHGNYKGLMEALKKASFNPEIDTLIAVGDTLDGWSQAPEVIEYYIDLNTKRAGTVIYVLGNHDIAFLVWVKSGCKKGAHLMFGHGGQVTEHVYLNNWYDEIEKHYDFIHAGLQYHHDKLTNSLYVHAGWDPKYVWNSDEQLATQEYQWTRSFWQEMYEGKNHARAFNNVFIGHSPTISHGKGAIPFQRRNVWNIDTGGAYLNGKVTVMNTLTFEYWQSELGVDLYPTEKGRGKYNVK